MLLFVDTQILSLNSIIVYSKSVEESKFVTCLSGFVFQDKDSKSREVDVDIDELLDMDSDDQRRRHLQVVYKTPHFISTSCFFYA